MNASSCCAAPAGPATFRSPTVHPTHTPLHRRLAQQLGAAGRALRQRLARQPLPLAQHPGQLLDARMLRDIGYCCEAPPQALSEQPAHRQPQFW